MTVNSRGTRDGKLFIGGAVPVPVEDRGGENHGR